MSDATLPLGNGNGLAKKYRDMGDGTFAEVVATGSDSVPSPMAGPASIVAGGAVTRPADTAAYAVGDLIANSVTAGSVTPLALPVARVVDRTFVGRRLRLKVNSAAWKAATVRVHLFRNQPTVTVGDNGVLNNAETYAFSESDYIGYQDVALTQQMSDPFVKGFASCDFVSSPSPGTQNIFALLEARTAVTPASGSIFTLSLEALRD